MRKGGYVPASFWRRRFLEGASADVRLLALYLVTCGPGSVSGVVRASANVMAEETGLSRGAVLDALDALCKRHFVAPYLNPVNACEVWAVPAIVDHTPIPNGNVGKKVAKELADLMDGGAGAFWLALGVALKNNGGDRFLPELVESMIDRGRIEPIAGGAGVDGVVIKIEGPLPLAPGGRIAAHSVVMIGGGGSGGRVESNRPHPHDPYDDERVQIGGARKAGDPPATPEPVLALDQVDAITGAWPNGMALQRAWNALAKVTDLEPQGDMSLDLVNEAGARVAQLGGLGKIPALLCKVAASDFLLGKRANRDGELYTLTFAAMCRESMFLKIMEGAYDNPAPK